MYDLVTLGLAARKADAVVVSSELEYEDAVEFGIRREKLRIIPMGIDVEEPPPGAAKKEGNSLKILFLGRLARVRRVELLLRAVEKLSVPFHVTLVGGEEETSSLAKPGYLNELKNLCADLGIASKVTFTGPKPPGELPMHYNEADIFVYPSRYENFAQPILEAAAHGLPIIATRVGVAREIVRDGETGFLVPGDPEAIRDRIERLRDANTRREMGENISQCVRKKFGWDHVMQQYLELYRSL